MANKRIFFTYNNFLQQLFNCRVYKVCIDSNIFSCPNRDGTKAKGGCIFCDEKGASSRVHGKSKSISDQIKENIIVRKSRYNAKKFIVYFQSFSNTYADIATLKKAYDEAVFANKDIIGLSIATRPDCIDEEKIKLIKSYKDHLPYVNIEYGMQSANNNTLNTINRHSSHEDFLNAVNLTKKHSIDCSAHVILGLPKENKNDMLYTADELSRVNINGVKIHMLVAMEETILANLYRQGKWTPLTYEEFIFIAASFIERLPENCVIHRIAGHGHPLHIVAPSWVYDKKKQAIMDIEKILIKRKSYQGKYCRYPQ